LESEGRYLKRNLLIYGTYKKKEFGQIVLIYIKNGVDYVERVHEHSFVIMES
jgi:hypothetical protein